jgi:hypothetical protein
MEKKVEVVSGAYINALEAVLEEEFAKLAEIKSEYDRCVGLVAAINGARGKYANGQGEVIVDKDELDRRETLLADLTCELDYVENHLDEIEFFLVQRPEQYVENGSEHIV